MGETGFKDLSPDAAMVDEGEGPGSKIKADHKILLR